MPIRTALLLAAALAASAEAAYRPESGDPTWTGVHTWTSSATFQDGDFSIAGSTLVVTGGRVGIGTSSPSDALHLHANSILMSNTGGTGVLSGRLEFENIGAGGGAKIESYRTADIGVGNGGDLRFYTQTDSLSPALTERLRIEGEGDIGIGTTDPIQMLHIERSSDTDTVFRLVNFNVSSNAGALVSVNTEAGGYDPRIAFTLGGGGLDWRLGVDNDDDDKFKIAGANDNGTDVGTSTHLTISTNGAVGIGTDDSSTFQLSVAGGIRYNNAPDGAQNMVGTLNAWLTNSVGTSATKIADMNWIGNGGICVVQGQDGSNVYSDLVWVVYNSGATAMQSTTVTGSPAARTYSVSGVDFRVAHGSGSYNVRVSAMGN